MSLGKRQLETLVPLVAMCTRSMREGHVRAEVRIGQHRAPTREFGSGIAIQVRVVECYPEGDYPQQWHWIADCQYDYTALEKGQEIARYFVDQGVPREQVRLFER